MTETVLTPGFTVVSPGTLATIQDWPGRLGYWSVGVPPAGPMDCMSFRLGNLALGNPEGMAGLELTMAGPALRFQRDAVVMVTGAPTPVTVDARPVEQWVPQDVPAGALVEIGTPSSGMRSYLLIRGGISAADVLGSAATFDLGELGGLAGRPLRAGDVVPVNPSRSSTPPAPVPPPLRTPISHHWRLAVLEGPHGAPQFVTEADVEQFYAARWTVQLDPARTGVRLSGPKPAWARRDGGDAGLHPSNIQDTPYAVGAVTYTGDVPIVFGPDGPSLGRFTSPATVVSADRWKLGQLRPGDTVEFLPVTDLQADEIRRQRLIAVSPGRPAVVDGGLLLKVQATRNRPKVTFRRSGDDNLLIEYGEMTLDISLRMRVHALAEAIAQLVSSGELTGMVDITPGIRSLQLHVDPDTVPVAELLGVVRAVDEALPSTRDLVVSSRTVRLPLSWADPSLAEVGDGARAGAAGSEPADLEFIRRINGLDSVQDLYRTVFAAEYLVLGLGAGYLGAPVATPLDPRHRLVATRCDEPGCPRAANVVGLGGGYLSLSGVAGPGDSQLVGRTLPIWSPPVRAGIQQHGPEPQQRRPDETGAPWLLRCFDRINWYPVDPEELVRMRAEVSDPPTAVRMSTAVTITEGTFSMADYDQFLVDNLDSIAEHSHRQSSAFADQRLAWQRAGAFPGGPAA